MSQQNKFDIVINAVDKASKPIANINKSMERMLRPIQQVSRSVKGLGKELHLDKMARGVAGAARMGQGLGVSSPLLSGLAFSGGVVGSAAALSAAVAKMTVNLGAQGTRIGRVMQRTGVSGAAVQRYRGAAKLLGMAPESMDAGLGSLSDTMRNAQFDPELAMLFNKLGVKPVMKPDGTPDVGAMLPKMADAVAAQKNPATAAAILNRMGIGELFPLLRDGSRSLENFSDKAQKAGIVLDEKLIQEMTDFDRSLHLLKTNVEGLGNSISAELMPSIKSGVDWLNGQFGRDRSKDPGLLEHPLSPMGMLADMFQFGEALGTPGWVDPGSRRHAEGKVTAEGGPFKRNNPGNLRPAGSKTGFQSFSSTMDGLAAMAGQLGLYFNRDGLSTIGQVVSKYAPAGDKNDTAAYIRNVSQRTGFGPNQSLNLNDPGTLQAVMQAMVQQEQGAAAKGLDPHVLAQAIAQALKGVTLNAKLKAPAGSRQVAWAMPSDGVR